MDGKFFDVILQNTNAINEKINTLGERSILFEEKVMLAEGTSHCTGLFTGCEVLMIKYIERCENYDLSCHFKNALTVYVKNISDCCILITLNECGDTFELHPHKGMWFMNKQPGGCHGKFVQWYIDC